jgi:shikimate dehydrogenase
MDRQLFAILGNPVSHSKSPLMHNLAFKGLGFDGCYTRYLLKDGQALKEMMMRLGLAGANITVPHKEVAFKACDHLDSFAKRAGAINTIIIKEGKLHGYNTDAPGFLRAIREFSEAKTVLFLGAGGTARATSLLLRDRGYEVTILNRGAQRLRSFADDGFDTATYENFKPKPYDLVINMTSAGLKDDLLPAPKAILDTLIPTAKACIDVVYGRETPFLKLAKRYGKPTKEGSDMLLYQGVIAFDYFTDHHYSHAEIEFFMKKAFII